MNREKGGAAWKSLSATGSTVPGPVARGDVEVQARDVLMRIAVPARAPDRLAHSTAFLDVVPRDRQVEREERDDERPDHHLRAEAQRTPSSGSPPDGLRHEVRDEGQCDEQARVVRGLVDQEGE